METQEQIQVNMEASDSYETKHSKQRASVKWLLSKAFNNRVPENLQEPFYRDQEDQERLKPPIIGGLANAELYCLALANIYSDPNYHNLNHWNILQTLVRKGVPVADPPDCTLTETVLIQTNPLRMTAHMCVMEALMQLYGKEVVTWERVNGAVQRFGTTPTQPPANSRPDAVVEAGLLAWINSACSALNDAQLSESGLPQVSPVSSIQEVCDGTALAALISFYCPDSLPRNRVRVGKVTSLQDCLHNLMLVYDFCMKQLPHNVFHMLPEDVAYMRGSMRQNLIVLLSDLFNMLEVHPVKCVKYPSQDRLPETNEHGVQLNRRCLPPPQQQPIPDLRPDLNSETTFKVSVSTARGRAAGRSACSTPEGRGCSPQRDFTVHRNKPVPTLSNIAQQGNADINMTPAGRPSTRSDEQRSYSGRRSRRSSITDDSQLTVENFGGSQDKLNFAGRNPEKELATVNSMRKISAPAGEFQNSIPDFDCKPIQKHNYTEQRSYAGRRSRSGSITDNSQLTVENFGGSQDRLNFIGRNPEKDLATVRSTRKISAPAGPIIQNTPVRSTKQDARGSIQFFYEDYQNGEPLEEKRPLERQYSQPQNCEPSPPYQPLRRQLSNDNVAYKQSYNSLSGTDVPGFYMNNECSDMTDGDIGGNKMATFANMNKIRSNGEQGGIQLVYSTQESQMDDPRLRRKTTSFATLPNTTTWQQQSMQQEIQQNGVVSDETLCEPDQNAMASQLNNIRLKLEEKRRRILRDKQRMEAALGQQRAQMGQQAFLQAVARSKADGSNATSPAASNEKAETETPDTNQEVDIKTVENKWLDHDRRTPDIDGMGYDEYHQSIAQMNSSLQELQTDITRLTNQQNQLKANKFFIHQPNQQSPNLYQQSFQSPQQNTQSPQQNFQSPQPNFQSPQPNFQSPQQNFQSPQQNFQSPQQNFQSPQKTFQNFQSPQPNFQSPQQNYQQNHNNGFQSNYSNNQFVVNRSNNQMNYHNNQSIHNQNYQQKEYDNQSYNIHNQDQYQNNLMKQNIPQLHAYSTHNVSTPPRLQSCVSQPQLAGSEANGQFFLHESSPQRRTWANRGQQQIDDRNWQSPSPQRSSRDSPVRGWKSPSPVPARDPWNPQPGFLLHDPDERRSNVGDGEPRPVRRIALEELDRSSGAAVAVPPDDAMEPQNISFISSGMSRLNISSGTRTYRIPSPTRRQRPPADGDDDNKGFYISLDDNGPRRPKPQLRTRRNASMVEGTRAPPPGRSSPTSGSPQRRVSSPQGRMSSPQRRLSSPQRRISSPEPNASPLTVTRVIARPNSAEPAALIISDLESADPESVEEMERKKERIMLLSLQRRQRAEEQRARAEQAASARRAKELALAEQRAQRRAEQSRRREEILQQHKLKKAIEEAEREGKHLDKSDLLLQRQHSTASAGGNATAGGTTRRRAGGGARAARPRTIHVDGAAALQRSTSNLTAYGTSSMRRDYYRGSQDSLSTVNYRDSPLEENRGTSPGANSTSALGRRGSCKTSREHDTEPETNANRGRSKYSTYQNNFKTGRKSSSLMNLSDSGLGRATPRGTSPGGARTLPSPSGPGSLPHRARRHDDSDTASNHSSMADYSGPRLYKQPTTKSNRGIMLNAVEYCVFPGAVNREAKQRVLEEIARSESKHFLVLFRDAGCQFRALYSYCPETEAVTKLYGTGPRAVNDRMFDKFFKYNSGSKCFSVVHTKHLTVTIDAFTIHNSLWQGKKVQLPSKKDMALVI